MIYIHDPGELREDIKARIDRMTDARLLFEVSRLITNITKED